MISIFILTLNEEQNIRECLASVEWADDVVVLDSYSTDETVPLAESLGDGTFVDAIIGEEIGGRKAGNL